MDYNFYNELLMDSAGTAEAHEICIKAAKLVKHLDVSPQWRIGRTRSGSYLLMANQAKKILILDLGFDLDKCDIQCTYSRAHAAKAKFKALIK